VGVPDLGTEAVTKVIRAVWRRILLAYLRFCLRCIEDERETYERAGVPLGPRYLENSERQASLLRSRIAMLETGLLP